MKGSVAFTAIACLAGTCGLSAPAFSQTYTVTDLGTPNGMASSEARGINNVGQVIGMSGGRAYIWNGTVASPIAVDPNIYYIDVEGINDSGVAVGTFARQELAMDLIGYEWNGSVATFLNCYDESWVQAINNAGLAVGYCSGVPGVNAAIWKDTVPTYLTQAPTTGSQANAVNDAGQVIGELQGAAVLWNGTTPTALALGVATAINNHGQIVGESDCGATLLNGTTPTCLRTLSAAGGTSANSINDPGQIVGAGATASGATHATLWKRDGTVVDLNSSIGAVPAQSVTLTSGVGINNRAWIVANGTNSVTGNDEAYLLIPVSDAFDGLAKQVRGAAPGSGLAIEVLTAQFLYDLHQEKSACVVLNGFVQEAQRLNGRPIAQAVDSQIIANGQSIEGAINCNSAVPDQAQ